MRKFLFLLIFFPLCSHSQSDDDAIYYDKNFFLIEGTIVADSLKESPYDRLHLLIKIL